MARIGAMFGVALAWLGIGKGIYYRLRVLAGPASSALLANVRQRFHLYQMFSVHRYPMMAADVSVWTIMSGRQIAPDRRIVRPRHVRVIAVSPQAICSGCGRFRACR